MILYFSFLFLCIFLVFLLYKTKMKKNEETDIQNEIKKNEETDILDEMLKNLKGEEL